jgi:hypothetical protein
MPDARTEWNSYVQKERALLTPILTARSVTLEERQPHLMGERYLMQAISTTSGKKITLLGRTKDGTRVVIKATSDPAGAQEIEEERRSRRTLSGLVFASYRFHSPKELYYFSAGGMTVSIQEYIEQTSTFLARPLEEQFALALQGFKTQEGAHATTYGHLKRISKVFTIWESPQYLLAAQSHIDAVQRTDTEHVTLVTLGLGYEELKSHAYTIDQYSGFLTHSDFVPHNIRVADGKLYLLDYSSLRFGNKYESWARFINFMVLHNPPLADLLETYVHDNRSSGEYESLRLMRIYRAIEILAYYAGILEKSEGQTRDLNRARITFWTEVLGSILERRSLAEGAREAYIEIRDTLRSPEEKERQKDLH